MATRHLVVLAAALIGLAGFGIAHAQYPERSVKVVVPYPPGGATDITARLISQKLSQALGKSFVVENMPGAGGNIGTAAVARSPADGHTLLVAGGAFVINVTLYPRPGYDVKRDFSNVALLVTAPMILLTHPALNVNSVAELVALAKSKPGQISYGSSSIGGAPHLAMELLKTRTGTNIVHIPYKGAAPALNDLAGGHVSVVLDSMVTGLQFAKTGKAKALAVTARQRTPLAPELPTVAESGVPDYEAYVWYAFFAPAGTPAAINELLNREINKALRMPDVRQKLVDLGSDPAPGSIDDINKFIDAELTKWTAIVKASGAKAE